MRMICVDDEALVLQLTLTLCRALPRVTEVEGFTDAHEALSRAREHPVDVALLDIDMPGMSGPELAFNLKKVCPEAAIIFLTGYRQLAAGAAAYGETGYLLKPVGREKLAAEVERALAPKPQAEPTTPVAVRTFGTFRVFAGGKTVVFPSAGALELLALLVHRQGETLTHREIIEALRGEEALGFSARKKLDAAIHGLRAALEEYGIGEILQSKFNRLRIRPELLDCDLYRALAGDVEAINAYRGEYMSPFAWASLAEAYRNRPQER